MTMIFQDSCDLYASSSDLSFNYSFQDHCTIYETSGRFGGGSIHIGGDYHGLIFPLPTSETNLWTSFAFKCDDQSAVDSVVLEYGTASTTIQVGLTYNPVTGVWKVWSGNRITLLGQVTVNVSSGWHWLDFRVLCDPSAGSFEFWLDDAQALSVTGVNTQPTASQPLVYVAWGDNASPQTMQFYLDDIFIYDSNTSRLGDSRIEAVVPTSDAGPNQGTPLSGTTHYGAVNEAQYSTANYLTLPDTSGDKEVFGHGAIVSTPTTVWGVKVILVSSKTDAGSFALEPLVISNGVESDGAGEQLLTTSYGIQTAMFPNDPNTGAPWTYAAANASKVGFKVV